MRFDLLNPISRSGRLRERAWRKIRAGRNAFKLSGFSSSGPCGCCGGSGCSVTINGQARGCGNLALPGATVEAHDATSGGTLLGSTTADGSGNYTINATGAIAGNNIVLVFNSTRFVQTTSTLTWTSGTVSSTTWKCGATTNGANRTLTIDSANYACACCPLPIAKTLYMTHSIWGSVTLTHNGVSTWTGSTTTSFPGGSVNDPAHSCVKTCSAANPVTISFQFRAACTFTESWPISLLDGACPQTTSSAAACNDTTGLITPTCPPSAFNWSMSGDWAFVCCAHVMFGAPGQTWTNTITE